mmetsp:Transcript_15557/g.35644  ORF Transcript_15557/g.35644 Transcript_15557/m.35644 type:complete len:1020 (-) Transcript_15557:113-3172(-)
MANWFGWNGQQAAPAGTIPRLHDPSAMKEAARASGAFAAGDVVEYFSASQKTWIPAKVLQVNPSGTYNLDCKPEVPADKIRRPQAPGSMSKSGSGEPKYAPGDLVEYFSATQNDWIPAKVLAANPSRGTYNLDCKPEVPADKIRPRKAEASGAGGGGSAWNLFSSAAQTLGAPFGTTSGQAGLGGSTGAPVQLLRVRRSGSKWQYEVCSEGAQMLERHGSRRIAVTSVCGLQRTGKSYLLNLLLEKTQRQQPSFQVGSGNQACTDGLWLWSPGDTSDDSGPLHAFIDCEGFGNTTSDKARDAKLVTLCALLSSVLVLNTKGALNEGLFNALSNVCRFAEHIEERGHEANRPVLFWVLRDFMLELRDASGKATTPDEYMEQALFAGAGGQTAPQSARDVRQNLVRFFSHRTCMTLARPAVEEGQLQRLDAVPYKNLRSEFRSGVEAMRGQLMSSAAANPKTVGGQPLSCFAFVALLRHFSSALNEGKTLNVKGSWEHVQHTACGSLADELRSESCNKLRALAKGGALTGGAQLPLSEEPLRTVLRDQRHMVKSEWEGRAIGDENVRREYWQELKESLAREEKVVQQANARLSDQQLMEALKEWQAWLDDDNSTWTSGEEVINRFGKLTERMPAAPLARVSRTAMESAGRRVIAVRHALDATKQQSDQEKEKALAWGNTAVQKEGQTKTELQDRLQRLEAAEAMLRDTEQSHSATKEELQARHRELEAAQAQYEEKMRQIEESHGSKHAALEEERTQLAEELKQLQHNHQSAQLDLSSRDAELQDSKGQVQSLMAEVEAARSREQELKGSLRIVQEKEAALRAEIDETRANAARDNADRLASERLARVAEDSAATEKRRLEVDLEQARGELDQLKAQLMVERDTLKNENEKTRAEHSKLVEETRQKLEQERKLHTETLHEEKNRLLDRERNTGVLEGQVQAVSSENTLLREQLAELKEQVRSFERARGEHKEEREALQKSLDAARVEHSEQLKRKEEDHDRLLEEAKKAKAQKKCTKCVVM